MKINTYNPIKSEEAYITSFFPQIPYAAPKTAILLCRTGTSAKMVITENTKVKTSDIKRGKFNWQVEIDMHSHSVAFRDQYLSRDNVSKFEIEIRATASVVEPDSVYEQGVADVAEAIEEEMRGRIQEAASRYDLDSSPQLREAIKAELGDFYQLDSGIQVNNMNVLVRMDPKYEKLKERTQYERIKAAEAQKLQEIYQDDYTAIFAEVAEGSITAAEASDRMKKSLSDDFDERLRQLRAAAPFANELKEKDLVRASGVANQMEQMIQTLLADSSKKGKLNEPAQAPQLEGEKNPYAPFDEDD